MNSYKSIPAAAVALLACVTGAELRAQPASNTQPADSGRMTIAGYGEVRTRSEWDRPIGANPSDFFTLMRSRLGVRITASPNALIVMEAQDSRVLGDVSATARQSFDLHQGYLQLTNNFGNAKLVVRAGRQEIALANERLVGAVGWSNFGRSFDALRVSIAAPGVSSPRWNVDMFGATIEERGRHFGANPATPTQDHSLGGVFASRALDAKGNARAELTALMDVGSDYRSYRDARRYTFDIRARQANYRGFRAEVEGALQTGNQQVAIDSQLQAQTIRGWLAGARVGNAVSSGQKVSLTAGADIVSGDATPADGRYSGFSTLYGTNHGFYGLIDIVGDPAASTRERGLRDLFLQGDFRINDRVRARTELHHMQLVSGSDRDLGIEADAVLPIVLNEQTRVEVGYSAFRAGSGASAVGLGAQGKIQQWAYVQLRAAFQR